MKKKSISLLLTMLLLSFFAITNAFCLTFYVDTSIGKDNPSWGVKPEKPWKTISYAVLQTSILEQSEDVLINVAAGTYNENISIDKRSVSLVGTGPPIIDGGGQDVITIDGVQRVVISGFTIQNGKNGIISKRGSTVEVHSTTVKDSDEWGVEILENSTLSLTECNIKQNGIDGIAALSNSSAILSGNIVSNDNGRDGLLVSTSSSAFLNATIITTNSNGRRGISISEASNMMSMDSTITSQNNISDGFGVFGSSNLTLFSNETLTLEQNGRRGLIILGTSWTWTSSNSVILISNNTAQGLYMAQNASIDINCSLIIENNAHMGIFVNNSAHVDIENPAVVTVRGTTGNGFGIWVANASVLNVPSGSLLVENNASNGISVIRGSKIRLGPGSLSAQILDNTGRGLFVDDGSSVECTGTTITGNSGDDVVLSFGSRATLNGNTIGSLPISCDGTVLSRGDPPAHLCP